jgi:hypothetical protein
VRGLPIAFVTAAPPIIRNIPALTLRAEVVPDSIDPEKRTADVVWTTGARVLRQPWFDEPFLEELSLDPKHVRMDFLSSGRAPVLDAHQMWGGMASQVGVVDSARLEAKRGTATLRFSQREAVTPLWGDIKDRIVGNVSMGYRVYRYEKTHMPGQDGGDPKYPVYRAVDWGPFEISPVPIPADTGAGFMGGGRADASTFHSCTLISRGQEITMEPTTPAPTPTTPPAAPAPAAATDAAAEKAAQERGAQLERERVAGIQHSVRAAKLGAELEAKLIKDGVPLDAARAQILDALATRDEGVQTTQHVRIEAGEDNRDKWLRGVSAWLFEKAGNGLVQRAKEMKAKGFADVELDGGEFRGMKIVDIARMCVERAGGSLKWVYNDHEIIKRALTIRGGNASTSDFSVLFENVMFKQMRASYETQAHTWRRWMGTDTVSNFLTHNRFLNGSFGTLPVVAENGEYKNIAIPDGAKNSISTETRGAIIALSRQAMINDDMGALSDVSVRFGMTAARTIEVQAYAMLALNSGLGPTMADSQPFFHSNRANVSTSAPLSIAAISADKVKMREQKDISSNDYLDLMPAIALVPTGLEDPLLVLNKSAWDHDSTKLQKPNAVQGLFKDIVSSPRLSWSTTRRYLFTDAKEAFKVVFLEGSGEGPVMESQEGWRVDGLEWKARIDFKVNAYDPKTALTNAGT